MLCGQKYWKSVYRRFYTSVIYSFRCSIKRQYTYLETVQNGDLPSSDYYKHQNCTLCTLSTYVYTVRVF